jgi:hypothetical protein
MFSGKVGVYKLFNVGPIKVGPELALEIFEHKPGFDMCREMKSWQFKPLGGIRVQW